MNDYEKLIDYLNHDKWQNVCAFSSLKRYGYKDIKIVDGGARFTSLWKWGDCVILSYDKLQALKELTEDLKDDTFVYFCTYSDEDAKAANLSFYNNSPCRQFVYKLTTPYETSEIDGITFDSLKPEEAEEVFTHYTMKSVSSVAEIKDDIINNVSVGARSNGKLVGFVGVHDEGSMGMLEVYPEYRRKNIGVELSKRIHNAVLQSGFTPYGHIMLNNKASMQLQTKLNNEYTDKLISFAVIKK